MMELPKHWMQYNDTLLDMLFKTTFRLFGLNLAKISKRHWPLLASPFVYMTLIDNNCTWFKLWMKESWARKAVGLSLQKMPFATSLLRFIINKLEYGFVIKEVVDEAYARDLLSSLFDPPPPKSIPIDDLIHIRLYSHSFVILGSLPLYTETRFALSFKSQGT